MSYRSRQWVKARPGLLALRLAVQGQRPGRRIVDSETLLCIEGFPRSANSFAVSLTSFFLELDRNRIAHHTHSVVNIRRAVRRGVPAIVVIRRPADSCRSMIKLEARLQRTLTLDDVLRAYDDFHRALMPLLPGVVLAPFDVTVKRPYTLLKTVARLTGLPIPEIHDPRIPKPPGLERHLHQRIVAAGVSPQPRPVEPVPPAIAEVLARCEARYATLLDVAPHVAGRD